jgi:hypothetical protein
VKDVSASGRTVKPSIMKCPVKTRNPPCTAFSAAYRCTRRSTTGQWTLRPILKSMEERKSLGRNRPRRLRRWRERRAGIRRPESKGSNSSRARSRVLDPVTEKWAKQFSPEDKGSPGKGYCNDTVLDQKSWNQLLTGPVGN